MFRPMRRARQALPLERCFSILDHGTSGVLAVSGDDGYPYAVPLSYVRVGSCLYFHCAQAGHKLDALARNPKVSFCVIGQDQVVPECFTTYYRSVIVFGTARMIDDPEEKKKALELLAERYYPGGKAASDREIADEFDRVCMLELSIEHISGKQARELIPTTELEH